MKPYHWFKGESVHELFEQLGAAGPDSARLEVHQDGNKMTFRVIPEDNGDVIIASHTPDINDSHRCPPDCGGG